jgi:thiosulfate/3-mercaptopyruvate sulfurtransferase
MDWRTLIDAEALAQRLVDADGNHAGFVHAGSVDASFVHASLDDADIDHTELVVFDCRFSLADADAGEAAWRGSRLPGARYAHLNRDLSDLRSPHVPGSGRHPWPQAEAFVAWLVRNGVSPRTQVVAYDAGDGAYAARLWCLLRALGHRKVAVLDGGWAHWNALGLPVESGGFDAREPEMRVTDIRAIDTPATHDASGGFAPRFDALRLFDATDVQARLAAGNALIDARAAERYRGDVEPIDRVAGHVPGALSRPYAMNLQDGRFKSAERLGEEFRALLGAHHADSAIVMCGSGVTACHHLLALEHAGLHGAALFTGSWSGWIEDPLRPVAKGHV